MSKTEATTLVVRAIPGERYRYYVQSEGQPGLCHTVDLSQRQGMGSCTCDHYLFTVHKNQSRAIARNPLPHSIDYRPHEKQKEGVTQCRHIWGAERQLMRKNVRPFLSGFTEGDPPNLEGWRKLFHRVLNWREVKP